MGCPRKRLDLAARIRARRDTTLLRLAGICSDLPRGRRIEQDRQNSSADCRIYLIDFEVIKEEAFRYQRLPTFFFEPSGGCDCGLRSPLAPLAFDKVLSYYPTDRGFESCGRGEEINGSQRRGPSYFISLIDWKPSSGPGKRPCRCGFAQRRHRRSIHLPTPSGKRPTPAATFRTADG